MEGVLRKDPTRTGTGEKDGQDLSGRELICKRVNRVLIIIIKD